MTREHPQGIHSPDMDAMQPNCNEVTQIRIASMT